MTSSDLWDEATARRYDETASEMFDPEATTVPVGVGDMATATVPGDAGLEPERRTADRRGAPFTAESERHVSVWRKP